MLSLRHCMESCCFGATWSPSHDDCNENFITHLYSLSHRAICFFQSITEDMHINYVIACCCITPKQCYSRHLGSVIVGQEALLLIVAILK